MLINSVQAFALAIQYILVKRDPKTMQHAPIKPPISYDDLQKIDVVMLLIMMLVVGGMASLQDQIKAKAAKRARKKRK